MKIETGEKETIKKMKKMMDEVKKGLRIMTKDEEKNLIEMVKKIPEVATHFFCNFLRPMMDGIKYTFKIEEEVEGICHLVYAHFIGCNWQAFASFNYESSLLWWIKKCSTRIICYEARKSGLLHFKRSAANTRLTLLSMHSQEERALVVDLVADTQHHDILNLIYVKKLKDEVVCKQLGMDNDKFVKCRKAAEKFLKQELIKQDQLYVTRYFKDGRHRKVNLISEVLADKYVYSPVTECGEAFDDATRKIGYVQQFFGDNDLDELFPGKSPEEQLMEFDKMIINEIEWASSMEKTIFVERYINHRPALSLAKNMGVEGTYIDVKFSRLSQFFANYADKRKACEMKNRAAVAKIIRHANVHTALRMPNSVAALTSICSSLRSNEMSMCREIAKIYFGNELDDDSLMKHLREAGIVNKVSTEELRLKDEAIGKVHVDGGNKKHYTHADHYLLSSIYVTRHCSRKVADDLYNFSGPARYRWNEASGGQLTVAIGLTFMKHLMMVA